MSQIYKRSVDFLTNISPKKRKPGESLDNLKVQLEKILQDHPMGHKKVNKHSNNAAQLSSRQNLIYLTGSPKKKCNNSSSAKPSSDLSETDLKVLLQNFYKLEGEEQQILIGHLKKLESNKPELVEDLKRFVRVASPQLENGYEDQDTSDCDLNELDDLDDILEGRFVSDSESDDDNGLVSKVTTKLKEDRKAIESTKNIIEILENTLEKNKTKKNNFLPKKQPEGNKGEIKKEIKREKVTEVVKTQQIKKKQINKNQEHKKEKYEQNWKKERRKFDSLYREMEAKYFGYRSYSDMKEYLENTGTEIYYGDNYFSFSDN